MQPDYHFAEEVIQFGTTIDTPPLYFISVFDLNNKLIRIGYQSFEVTIEDLLNNYKQITSCRNFIATQACFKIIQKGQFEGQLAIQSSKLSSYGLQLDKPCFKIHDTTDFNMQVELQSSISRIYTVYDDIDAVPVKVIIQGVEEDFQIFLQETLNNLKKRLIDAFKSIRHEAIANIHLFKNGFFISDGEATMFSYRITKDAKIILVIKEKYGNQTFLNVSIPSGDLQKIFIQPNQPFSIIKEYFQNNFEIQAHSQQLFYGGKELKNHQTMADKNIPRQSTIYLKFKAASQFNFLHPLTIITTLNGQKIPIREIKEGQSVLTFNSYSRKPSEIGDLVVSVATKEIKSKMAIKLDNYQQEIVLSPDSYLQLQNGQSMNITDICYQYDHGTWPNLLKIDGSTYKIKQIAHQDIKPVTYYKLILSHSQNYIAQNMIIHKQIVNILLKKNNIKDKKITLGVQYKDRIINIKQRLSKIINVPFNQISLSFDNRQLQNQLTLADYSIKSQTIITANQLQKISKSSILISGVKYVKRQNKIFYLQLSDSQKITIQYQNYRDKTVQQIMQLIIPNYQSSYFFLFLKVVIYPYQRLSQIQKVQNQLGENVIIVVKNEKLAFIQNINIKPSQVISYSRVLKKTSSKKPASQSQLDLSVSRIQVPREQKLSKQFEQAAQRIMKDESIKVVDFKLQQFYMPFLYFTSKQYSTRIWKRIKNFNKYRNEVNQKKSIYSIIKDLYINMNMLQSYYGKCFFGMKNFKCSRFFKEKDTFYWHNFIVAHLKDKQIIANIQPQNGTLFIIESLNGKQISKFSLHPSKQQILFAPFTYFMIEKIERKQLFDIVWLSQISSPVTFKKNIVLWVDDQPKNNINQIKKILTKNDIEILQVTSTILAEKWVEEFGWLLNWKGLKFKLISDMTRKENGTNNFEAGVDLLQKLYKNHGITAETLIFCGDRPNADKNIKARNIPKERCYSITVHSAEVQKFCQMGSPQAQNQMQYK